MPTLSATHTMSYAKLFRSLALVAGTLALLPACTASAGAGAGTPGASAGASASASATPRRDRNVLTRQEIATSGVTNLYDAVQRLRPHWLRGVNMTTRDASEEFVVYQGSTNLGGVEALRQLGPEYAAELRYLDASQATNTLPGLGSRRVSGAIVVVLPGAR